MLQFEFLLPFLPWLFILFVWMIILGLASVFKLEKYGVEVGPFMLFARTERFNNLLNRIGQWHPRAWRYIWSFFIGVAFLFSLYGFYFLGVNVWEFIKVLLELPAAPGPVTPLIPGVTMSFNFFIMILIPLIVAVIVHELAHGIAARADNIPVESSGLFLFLFFFGAFVEPDEEYIKIKSTRRQRARLYASGSGANLAVAAIAMIFLIFIIIPIPNGALINSVVSGSPADGTLVSGMVIIGMNDTEIHTTQDLSTFIQNARPGDLVIFTVLEGTIPLIVGVDPINTSRAYIGIWTRTYFPLAFPFSHLDPATGSRFYETFAWFFMITLSLGIINLLPIPPLDGDKLWKELIDSTISLERKSGKVLLWSLRIIALTILIANIVFTILNPTLLLLFFR